MVRHALFLVALLAAAQSVRGQDEAAGRAAEAAGDPDAALQEYLGALRALPDPPPLDADLRLRERIMAVVTSSGSTLPVPPEADEEYRQGQSLLQAQVELGSDDLGGLEAAAAHLRRAVRLAPWWPDAPRALATVEQKLKHYESAAGNLRIARLAAATTAPDPAATAHPATEMRGPAPAAGTGPATVTVYWPPQFGRNGNPNRLKCDGKVVAKLQEGRFIVLKLTPGFHTLDFKREVALDFLGGRDYWVRASYDGKLAPQKALRVVEQERAAAELAKGRMTPGDADHLFDATCSGSGKPSTR